eukprot:3748148-Prymnesium_polylepis.3
MSRSLKGHRVDSVETTGTLRAPTTRLKTVTATPRGPTVLSESNMKVHIYSLQRLTRPIGRFRTYI